jgi:hypothetical protein
MRRLGFFAAAALAFTAAAPAIQTPAHAEAGEYLEWSAGQARRIGQAWRVNGRVGGILDFRVVHTEHSYNYKLRATWLSREVIGASARLAQLTDNLTNDQTMALVKEAEAAGDTVILVELDPREGSGVIPLNWSAFLGPNGSSLDGENVVKGNSAPGLSRIRGLSGVFRRDYNYEAFWVALLDRFRHL